jgi:hypothetical protein
VLQYLSASFGTSALKLPFSCCFIFPHRYGLWSPSMVLTFFMFVPHLFDFLSVTDNAIHCGFSAAVLRCHRLLMIIQEATRTAERPLWIGVLLDGYEIVWITDGRDRQSGASMGIWWIFVQENCSARLVYIDVKPARSWGLLLIRTGRVLAIDWRWSPFPFSY